MIFMTAIFLPYALHCNRSSSFHKINIYLSFTDKSQVFPWMATFRYNLWRLLRYLGQKKLLIGNIGFFIYRGCYHIKTAGLTVNDAAIDTVVVVCYLWFPPFLRLNGWNYSLWAENDKQQDIVQIWVKTLQLYILDLLTMIVQCISNILILSLRWGIYWYYFIAHS